MSLPETLEMDLRKAWVERSIWLHMWLWYFWDEAVLARLRSLLKTFRRTTKKTRTQYKPYPLSVWSQRDSCLDALMWGYEYVSIVSVFSTVDGGKWFGEAEHRRKAGYCFGPKMKSLRTYSYCVRRLYGKLKQSQKPPNSKEPCNLNTRGLVHCCLHQWVCLCYYVTLASSDSPKSHKDLLLLPPFTSVHCIAPVLLLTLVSLNWRRADRHLL